MAITFPGSVTEQVSPASSSVSLLNGTHTTTSDTDLLICCVTVEGNETLEPGNEVSFDTSGTDTELTLISDSGLATAANDVRCFIYGLINPDEISSASTSVRFEFSGNQMGVIWINVAGVDTTSLAAATNDLNTVNNESAGSTTVFSSGGSSGNGLLYFAAAQGSDMNPSSANNSFTELVEGETGATTSDMAYNIGYHLSAAPSAVTVTWDTSDENAGCFIELVSAETDVSETLTGFEMTFGLGTITTDTPDVGAILTGFGISFGLGTISTSTGQPGSADGFGILIEGTTDLLLQEDSDVILLEASQQPVPEAPIILTGFLRPILRSRTETGEAKTTVTRTVRLISDVSNLITITTGDNLDIVYNIVDQDGNAVDITGGSIAWKALRSGTTTAVISKTSPSGGVALTTPSSGVITVTVDPADTASLLGTYILDGEYTDSGGDVFTFEDGGLRVK